MYNFSKLSSVILTFQEVKLIVVLSFKNAEYWNKLVTRGGGGNLWFTVDWEVVADATYGTQGIRLKPPQTKGNLERKES